LSKTGINENVTLTLIRKIPELPTEYQPSEGDEPSEQSSVNGCQEISGRRTKKATFCKIYVYMLQGWKLCCQNIN